MLFQYPNFLYALFLVLIPVIIHLFNFRRYKRITFSDIRFLKELTEQNKKQQTLKQWLVLASRILAISFLVLAFARPYIPAQNGQAVSGSSRISIYLDNSFSMQALGKKGNLLEEGRQAAAKIAMQYPEDAQFQLLTNDFEGKHQRLVNRKAFLEMLQEVQVSGLHRHFDEIYKRQTNLLSQTGAGANLYWISDFQKNMESGGFEADSAWKLIWVPLEAHKIQNVWIDSAWYSQPYLRIGNRNELKVRIKNAGEQDITDQPLVLKIDGQQKLIRNISCKAGSSQTFDLVFSLPDAAPHAMALSITDYPLTFDDTWYLSAQASANRELMLVYENVPSPALLKVFSLDSFYHVNAMQATRFQFSTLPNQSLVILDQPDAISSGMVDELLKYINEGGVICLLMNAKPADQASVSAFLQRLGAGVSTYNRTSLRATDIEISHPLFANVFSKMPHATALPGVQGYHSFQGARSQTLLKLENGDPLLFSVKVGKGSLYVLTASIKETESNIASQAVFVPLMLNLPLQRAGVAASCIIAGDPSPWLFACKEAVRVVSLENESQQMKIPAEVIAGKGKIYPGVAVQQAGAYKLKAETNLLGVLAVNHSREESNPEIANLEKQSELAHAQWYKKGIEMLEKDIARGANNTEPAWWALLFAFLFLLAETALLRWLK